MSMPDTNGTDACSLVVPSGSSFGSGTLAVGGGDVLGKGSSPGGDGSFISIPLALSSMFRKFSSTLGGGERLRNGSSPNTGIENPLAIGSNVLKSIILLLLLFEYGCCSIELTVGGEMMLLDLMMGDGPYPGGNPKGGSEGSVE